MDADLVIGLLAIAIGLAMAWEAYAPRAEDDTNEVDRMIDLGQQPGSWEP